MRVGVVIVAYNEEKLLKACLKQFPEWIERIDVLVSSRPWNGQDAVNPGRTMDVLRSCADPRVKVFLNHWRLEHNQRNFGAGVQNEMDWSMIVDADEYYTPKDWEKLQYLMKTLPQSVKVISANSTHTFWKTPEFALEYDNHKPPIALRPRFTSFWEKRETDCEERFLAEVTMEHFSWVRTDEEVWQKINNWAHSGDFDKKTWYNTKWLEWSLETENVHPYMGCQLKAVPSICPPEILAYFD